MAKHWFGVALAGVVMMASVAARAEMTEIKVAQQYGISYLPLMIMEEQKLDSLTVSMSHPDAQTALLSGASEVTAHFTSPPFQYQELEKPGIHTVLNSYDVLGGAATFNVVWTTSKLRSENPKLYEAFTQALDEATAIINRDKRAGAQTYLRLSKDKDSVEEIVKMLDDPRIVYTTTPQNVMKYVNFMLKTGSIKTKPDSWKDLFFPNVHSLQGS